MPCVKGIHIEPARRVRWNIRTPTPGNIAGVQSLRFGLVIANVQLTASIQISPGSAGINYQKPTTAQLLMREPDKSLAESDRRMGKSTVPGPASDAGRGQLGLMKILCGAVTNTDGIFRRQMAVGRGPTLRERRCAAPLLLDMELFHLWVYSGPLSICTDRERKEANA